MSRHLLIASISVLICLSGCGKGDEKSVAATDPSAADTATPIQKAMIGRWELDRQASAEKKYSTAHREGGLGYQFNADHTGMRRIGKAPAEPFHWKSINGDGQAITLTLSSDRPGVHDAIVTLFLSSPDVLDQLRMNDSAGTSMIRRTSEDIGIPQGDKFTDAVTLSPSATLSADLGNAMRVAVARDGQNITVRGSVSHGNFTLWNLDARTRKFAIDQGGVPAMPVAISPDGKKFATADYLGPTMWDVVGGQRVLAYLPKPGQGGIPADLFFSKGGEMLLDAAGKDVISWNTETGEQVFSVRADAIELTALALFPNGIRVATAGKENKIRIWEIPEATLARELDPGEGKSISALAINSDSGRLAAAIVGGTVRIYDLPGCEVRRNISPGATVSRLIFMPDGKTLVYPARVKDDWDILLTDVETGELRATLEGHTAAITSMDLTADGNLLVSVSDDKSLRIWDLRELNGRLQGR